MLQPITYIITYVCICIPVLIFHQMTCHLWDQTNYPVYQQRPSQFQNKQKECQITCRYICSYNIKIYKTTL